MSFGVGAEAALEKIVALARKDVDAIEKKGVEQTTRDDRHALVDWGGLLLQFSKHNVGKLPEDVKSKSMATIVDILKSDPKIAEAMGVPDGESLEDFLQLAKDEHVRRKGGNGTNGRRAR